MTMPHTGRTLYVSDLDGTLLMPDATVSTATARMLNEAIRLGADFTVATARTPGTLYKLLGDVEMRLPAIVMTGAALWNRAEGAYTDPCFLPQEQADTMLDIMTRLRAPAFIYSLRSGIIDITHIGPLSELERNFVAERADNPYKSFRFAEFGELKSTPADTLLFYCMQPDAILHPAYRRICEQTDLTPVYYHDIFGPETAIMEVFAPGSSKAAAIRRLALSTGAERIVAFGDNVNDLPMLREADVAVAVGNAIEQVKAEADIVIEPNTTDAVARFILADIRRRQ